MPSLRPAEKGGWESPLGWEGVAAGEALVGACGRGHTATYLYLLPTYSPTYVPYFPTSLLQYLLLVADLPLPIYLPTYQPTHLPYPRSHWWEAARVAQLITRSAKNLDRRSAPRIR